MIAGDSLRTIATLLESLAIPYMVVGSFASAIHGEPRSTQDLDIVIDPTHDQLEDLLAALDPDRFYVDHDVARDALRRRSMFNVIDMQTAWKIDLVLRRARPFSIEELGRRHAVAIDEVNAYVATAEDTIVAKLEWAQAGGSDRQLRDVAGILRLRGDSLDRAYIERWIRELGLGDVWVRAQSLV